MKNKFKLFGIIVLAAIIGFSAVSCKEADEGDTGDVSIVGTWVIEMNHDELAAMAVAMDIQPGLTVDTAKGMFALVQVPAKVTTSKLVFTASDASFYYLDEGEFGTAIMTAVMSQAAIVMPELTQGTPPTIPYEMDGNNVMIAANVYGTINGNKLTADEGTYTKK